ncbi:MAG: cupin domain-containing protein [Gammaproteobacteria bacterium]|nr:cupin domain-containing protein [Gammaproteobacteria bacterium]
MRHTCRFSRRSAGEFLQRYWQKSPRLLRLAFPGILPAITPEELAGLACETGVESRLIIKTGGQPGWNVRHGPFKTADFSKLPEKNWTLLVQDTDKHVPELADFLGHFDFIPRWRVDDLMISYAVDGGTVGPHVDAYDVFLLQVLGQRRWRITRKHLPPLIKPGLQLDLVGDFKPQHDWLLSPGDMLYLPPGTAHHGTAVGECMTFSIGMRAPTDAEMLADLSTRLLARLDKHARYTDPDLSPAISDPSRLNTKTLAAIRKRMCSALRMRADELDEWFGCFITEPKSWLIPRPARRRLTPAVLAAKLKHHKKIARSPAASLLWSVAGTRHIRLFVNGRCHLLPAGMAEFARLLGNRRMYTATMLAPWLRKPHAAKLLAELHNEGLLYFP